MPESIDNNNNNKFQWQSTMASLIFADDSEHCLDSVAQWRCSASIDSNTVLMIYRRNLKAGIEKNLAAQFPITKAYLGSAGFRHVSRELTDNLPPSSPLFTLFAAQLPGFILQFDDFEEPLKQASAALATIDFFSATVTEPDQVLAMDQRYFELFKSVAKIHHSSTSVDNPRAGLYQCSELHPEQVAALDPVNGQLRSSERDGSLTVVFDADRED